MMKKIIYSAIIALVLLSFQANVNAQVAINSTGTDPNASALLDLSGNNKGLLIPRISLNSETDMETITDLDSNSSSATGLLVYNTGLGNLKEKGFFYWNGERWKKLGDESPHNPSDESHKNSPDYKSVSYIGAFTEHDTVDGIKLGDFRFKIATKAGVNVNSDSTISDNVDIYIKYVGEENSVRLRSKSFTVIPSETFAVTVHSAPSNYSRLDFGLRTGTSRNTDFLTQDTWYGWGGSGKGIKTNNYSPNYTGAYKNAPADNQMTTEKKQYTFTVADSTVEEFYRCEFMVLGKYISDAKVVLYIERIATK